MASVNLISAAQWNTSFNTVYSQNTSQLTNSPYYYNVYTEWYVNTSWSVLTDTSSTTYFNTTWTTTWTTGHWTDGCVQVDSLLPNNKIAKDVKTGDTLILAGETDMSPGTGVVSYSKTKTAKGFRIETENGVSLVCSDSAPIPTKNGVKTPELLMGELVGTKIGDTVSWNQVKSVVPVGEIQVQHITVGDKCFWAGETDRGFMLHHNVKGVPFTSWTSYSASQNTTVLTSLYVPSSVYTTYSQNTLYGQNTSYYTAGYYTTSWTTSWNVMTNRLTGN